MMRWKWINMGFDLEETKHLPDLPKLVHFSSYKSILLGLEIGFDWCMDWKVRSNDDTLGLPEYSQFRMSFSSWYCFRFFFWLTSILLASYQSWFTIFAVSHTSMRENNQVKCLVWATLGCNIKLKFIKSYFYVTAQHRNDSVFFSK